MQVCVRPEVEQRPSLAPCLHQILGTLWMWPQTSAHCKQIYHSRACITVCVLASDCWSLCSHVERKRTSDVRALQRAMSGLLHKTARKAAGQEDGASLKDVPEDIEAEPDLDESHEEVGIAATGMLLVCGDMSLPLTSHVL